MRAQELAEKAAEIATVDPDISVVIEFMDENGEMCWRDVKRILIKKIPVPNREDIEVVALI